MRSRMVAVQLLGQVAALGLVLMAQVAWASPVSLATMGALKGALTPALTGSQETRPVLITPPPAGAPAGSTPLVPRYRIHAGDTLEIKIIGRPELTQSVTVAPDGTIVYPYVGELNVLGSTSSQIIARMQILLKRQMVNPQVLVSIVKRQMGQVSIIGPVKDSAKRELGDDWHVLHLIAAAGGLTVERPEFVTMRLIRKGGQLTLNIDPVQLFGSGDPQVNFLLEDGDLLVIQERDKSETMVNVLGEVGKPGQIPCPRDGSPLSVLAAAGGATSKASLSRAVIRRGVSGSPIAIDLSNPEALGPTIQIGPGDSLIIPANSRQVLVSGGVVKPGPVDLPERGASTLFWAIQQAGGLLQEADLKNVSLVRVTPGGAPVKTKVDLEKILKDHDGKGKEALEAAKINVLLNPGDAISVPIKGRRSSGFHLGLNEMMMGLSTYVMIRQIR